MRVLALRLAAAAVSLMVPALAPVAFAQPSIDVVALIKVVDEQPADMDRATWKEKRRDAAKRLGTIRDKRAVAALSKLAETETFDIIGEIAIQGLGQVGDASAIPVLQRIAADNSREKSQRELARKTLTKLGASPVSDAGAGNGAPRPGGPSATGSNTPASAGSASPPPVPAPAGKVAARDGAGKPSAPSVSAAAPRDAIGAVAPRSESTSTTSTATDLFGNEENEEEVPIGPSWPPTLLAVYERFVLAAGGAQLQYDSVRKRPSFDGDVAAIYDRRIEEQRRVLAWGGQGRLLAGYINPQDEGINRGAVLTAAAHGEARFYSGSIYGIGQAVSRVQLTYLSIDRADPNANDTKDARTSADLEIALGVGYGRVLDIGSQLRVRRLARALESNRALGRPIDDDTAQQLQSAWWALRGTTSTRRLLTATVAILRKAGVLLGEPDAGLTYEMLAVLRDGQLADRLSGFDAWLGFGEGVLLREDEPDIADGRVEQLLARARFGRQASEGGSDLSAEGFGRLALFTGDQPAPWAIGATARARRFTYGEYGDPIGAVDLGAEVALSSDDRDDSNVGLRIGGEVGFSWAVNLASTLRLSAKVTQDSGEITMIGAFEARYGLLDGAFSTSP